jgi:hypothetical protein
MDANAGRKGYQKDPSYVSAAVTLTCEAKKSRDACYYACNFILGDNPGTKEDLPVEDAIELKGKLTGECEPMNLFTEPSSRCENKYLAALKLYRAIQRCDMPNSGVAARYLNMVDEQLLWDTLRLAGQEFTGGILNAELSGLRDANDFVNRRKAKKDQDPIFLAKSIMNIMYFVCKKFDSVCSTDDIDALSLIDWSKKGRIDISRCALPGGIIPDYVYDVHTIQGKRMGRTDWDMNLVENAALTPLQPAFFEEGSWSIRYDYKRRHGLCSEKEYLASLEYRKTHEADPSIAFINSPYGTEE